MPLSVWVECYGMLRCAMLPRRRRKKHLAVLLPLPLSSHDVVSTLAGMRRELSHDDRHGIKSPIRHHPKRMGRAWARAVPRTWFRVWSQGSRVLATHFPTMHLPHGPSGIAVMYRLTGPRGGRVIRVGVLSPRRRDALIPTRPLRPEHRAAGHKHTSE